MFGGYDFYFEETFFRIIFRGRLYFETDESTCGEYERREMKRLRPNKRQTMKYHEVPADVAEDHERLLAQAQLVSATARQK